MAVVISDEPDIAMHMPALEVAASTARFIIELGCGDGNGSLRALARGFRRSPRAELYCSVDLRIDRPKSDQPTEAWWHLIHGDTADKATMEQAEILAGEQLDADLIFIDTNHTYEHLARELELWSYLAEEGTTWLFHDTWMNGQYNPMTDAIKDFAGRKGLTYSDLSRECNGLGMMC